MGVKNYPDTPRVYLDMDGVLADFVAYCEMLRLPPATVKLQRHTYRALPLIPGAREGVLALLTQGWSLFVLSKIPDRNAFAATEKILWLQNHFPEIGERIILSPDKGAVGRAQDFLVDDTPSWANAHQFRGTILHFGNQGTFWPEVVAQLAAHAPAA